MVNKVQRKPDVYCLMGPTASGKTNLAVELVRQHPFEIISVDSAQIYRGMDIGTGKPRKETLKIAPHRLLDIKDPIEAYSAADFRRDATREISSIIDSGKVPLLVGGTMLYFRILRDGMADLPSANIKVRQEIEEMAKNLGWAEVHRQLAKVDPAAAARIHLKDPQRLQRALEVFIVSGKSITDFYSEEAEKRSSNQNNQSFNLHFFGIQPLDRVVLNNMIKDRFEKRFLYPTAPIREYGRQSFPLGKCDPLFGPSCAAAHEIHGAAGHCEGDEDANDNERDVRCD